MCIVKVNFFFLDCFCLADEILYGQEKGGKKCKNVNFVFISCLGVYPNLKYKTDKIIKILESNFRMQNFRMQSLTISSDALILRLIQYCKIFCYYYTIAVTKLTLERPEAPLGASK